MLTTCSKHAAWNEDFSQLLITPAYPCKLSEIVPSKDLVNLNDEFSRLKVNKSVI